MKKLNVFYSSLVIVVMASASMALNARNSHVIYTPNPNNPVICDVRVPGRAILNTTTLGVHATNIQGALCQLVVTTVVIN